MEVQLAVIFGKNPNHSRRSFGRDLLISILILAVVTLIGFIFQLFGFTDSNIILIYTLGVLLTSLLTQGYALSIVVSILSVILFNFLFTEPRLTFHAYGAGYPVTFLIMLTASIMTGTLAAKLKDQMQLSQQAAYRTQLLFETNQLLQNAQDDEERIRITANQLEKLLNRKVEGSLGEPEPDPSPFVLPITGAQSVFGSIRIDAAEGPLDSFENSIVMSILGECSLSIENSRNAQAKEEAAVLARNEQLRANLLRTISHDLRTPLTSISGNISSLRVNYDMLDEETRMQIFTDIYDDSQWLIGLVENILSVTRIEEGRLELNRSVQLLDEMIEEALRHIDRHASEHTISTELSSELLLVRVDPRLIIQVLINLVNNAIKYTPPGSQIRIRSFREDGQAVIQVEDDGPGIPDADKPRVFEMFFTGENRIADSHRSLGLGLPLCRSILHAHGGQITLTDSTSHGCCFTFTLPLNEVVPNE